MSDTREIKRRPSRAAPADPAKLLRARMTAGLTQAELADKAGIGRQHVNAIENGTAGASIKTLRDLAKALRVKYADLLRDDF